MTIYDFKKTPLSQFLIKMITLLYQAELGELSNFNLSNLLHYLGILEIEADKKSARVNSSVYDSYNRNPFFQWFVCYHLDSLGLLYYHPRAYFEGIAHSKKYWSPDTCVRVPAGFMPLSKYESRRKKPKLSFLIDESLKFDPESLMTITVEEVNELKRKAFLKQEKRYFYLHSERNRAIKAINKRYDLTLLTLQQKKLRVERIEEKYQRNLTKYMGQVVSITHWAERNLRNKESDITQNKTLFDDLTTNLIGLKVDELTADNEQKKQFLTKKRIELELKQKQAEQLLIDSKVRLEELKVYYQAICAEATAVEQQLWTPELQDRYFAGIQVRKDAESL
jgi:hypothetical protein